MAGEVATHLDDEFLQAVHHGGERRYEEMLRRGVQVNRAATAEGRTALHVAAEVGHLRLLQDLLTRQQGNCELRDFRGRTALHTAAEGGRVGIVEELISRQAGVNAAGPNGETPLHLAIRAGHASCIQELLRSRADATCQGEASMTPLEVARHLGYEILVPEAAAMPIDALQARRREAAQRAAAAKVDLEAAEEELRRRGVVPVASMVGAAAFEEGPARSRHGGGGAWESFAQAAEDMRSSYACGYEFPLWSVEALRNGDLASHASGVVVYYKSGTALELVKEVATEREPCNIGMSQLYDKNRLQQLFGYSTGAYGRSSIQQLMPNIAIYCKTPMRRGAEQCDVHVINVIGYGFDSSDQPDYQYFFPLEHGTDKWTELVDCFSTMWRYIFECALRKGLSRIYLADIGGGAFASLLTGPGISYATLKEESLALVQAEYEGKFKFVVSKLPKIPDFAFENKDLMGESLLVNAWDPWSMVGNGNAGDNSLDGFFGRCTAMAVLCWPLTNPQIQYQEV